MKAECRKLSHKDYGSTGRITEMPDMEVKLDQLSRNYHAGITIEAIVLKAKTLFNTTILKNSLTEEDDAERKIEAKRKGSEG